MELNKNLQTLLEEVQENTSKDTTYAYFMSKEIKAQFKKLEKDYKKCKKIAAKNEHYFYALENILNNSWQKRGGARGEKVK